jgi:phage protein D
MFEIVLDDWDAERLRPKWSDRARVFEPGAPVEIAMGYGTRLPQVFAGDITGLEPEFTSDGPRLLTVRGYDPRHRLMRGEATRTYVRMKDSAIARQVATAHGLSATVVDTQVLHEQVFQRNQTDFAFLAARARRIGYAVGIDDRTLTFRPRRPRGRTVTIRADDDLLAFRPRLTTMGQVDSVVAHGWDDAHNQSIVTTVPGGQPTVASGPVQAARRNAAAWKVGSRVLADAARTKVELEQLAKSYRPETMPWTITGSGECIGRPELQAGVPLRVDGVGVVFGGPYFVTAAVHRIDPVFGFRTMFEIEADQ